MNSLKLNLFYKNLLRAIKAGLCLVIFSAIGLHSASSFAKANLQLKPASYKQLLSSQQAIEKQQYSQAEQILQSLIKETPSLKYDQLIAWRNLAALYLDQASNKPQQAENFYKKAIPALESALNLAVGFKEKTINEQQQLRLNLGQLLLQQQQYQKSAEQLRLYITQAENVQSKNKTDDLKSPAAQVYLLLAQAEYQQQHWNKVVPEISKAINVAKLQKLKPQQSWYQIKLAALYQLKQQSEMKQLLRQMLKIWPNQRQYWIQLYQIELQQSESGSGQNGALAVLKSAWLNNVFDRESDYLQLAQLMAFNGAPFQAAELIQQSLQSNQLQPSARVFQHLADYWLLARENQAALNALQKNFKLAPQPKLALKISRLFLSLQQYSQLITFNQNYLSEIKSMSNIEHTHAEVIAQLQLISGQAFWQQSQSSNISGTEKKQGVKQAIHLLKKASKKTTTKQSANSWLQHIASISDIASQ